MISRRQIIWRSVGPIFAIFTSNESFLVVDDRSGPVFSISQGTLPWQPILCKKMANSPFSSLWHSETVRAIVMQMNAFIAALIGLHRVKNGENWFSNFWVKVGEKMKIFPANRPKLAYIAEYLNNYWTSLYLCFSICRCIYADYKTAVSFAVVQGRLLW